MSPRTEEQFENIRTGRKHAILEAALDVFSEDGFHHASISKIAVKANISKGLVYNYFESKEALLREVLLHGTEAIYKATGGRNHSIVSRDDFRDIIRNSFRVLEENLDYWKLYFSLMLQAEVSKLIEQDSGGLVAPWMNITESYYKIKGSANPHLDAFILETLMDGLAMNFILDPTHFPFDEIIDSVMEKFS
jgi:AcrR family transcriptional regulator